MNTLYYTDNLKILLDYIAGETVDVVYLGPPLIPTSTTTRHDSTGSGGETVNATITGQDKGLRLIVRMFRVLSATLVLTYNQTTASRTIS